MTDRGTLSQWLRTITVSSEPASCLSSRSALNQGDNRMQTAIPLTEQLAVRDNGDPWRRRHNVALTNPSSPERAALKLAEGIDAWVSEHGVDGFSKDNIVVPLFQAFSDALNFELGRLDGGTLSCWASDRLRSLEIDPDTFEWVPDAAN